MTRGTREVHGGAVLQPGSAVSWYEGDVRAPDAKRTGRVLRRDARDPAWVWVRPDHEMGERRMRLADLDGPWRRPPRTEPAPAELPPALDLPAPVAQTLELLGLLHMGAEIQAGQNTVLRPVLDQLVARDYLRDCGGGRFELTARGLEVIGAGEVAHG